jgi:hypothetical protein
MAASVKVPLMVQDEALDIKSIFKKKKARQIGPVTSLKIPRYTEDLSFHVTGFRATTSYKQSCKVLKLEDNVLV